MKHIWLPLLSSISLLSPAGTIWADIQIENADLEFRIGLTSVQILTQPEPVKHLFFWNEDLSVSFALQPEPIPTEKVPLRHLFIDNQDLSFKLSLQALWCICDTTQNHSPHFLPIANPNAVVREELSLRLQANDGDDDGLTFSATNLPSGALLSGSTVTWTPTEDQIGTHTLNFTVSDGRGGTDSQNVQIEVVGTSLPGDIDGDGEITSGDAILVLRFASAVLIPTATQFAAADVDGDGEISSGDAILILRRAVGIIDGFPKIVVGQKPAIPISLYPLQVVYEKDGTLFLNFTLDQGSQTGGGDLLLTFAPDHATSGEILLDGLSPEALSETNIEAPGRIQVSFADAGIQKFSGLHLMISLKGIGLAETIPISLEGRLYNTQGLPFQEIRFHKFISTRLPAYFALRQNYPNPFNPSTAIRFELPQAEHLTLNIYALTGQLVRTLVNGPLAAGVHHVEWNGINDDGRSVSSGIYLYRLSVGDGRFTQTRRMLLLK